MRELEDDDLKFLHIFLRFWLPVLGYITLIFAVSSVSNLPDTGFIPHFDKIAHLMEYGLLGLLVGRAFRNSGPHFVTKFWFGLAIIAAMAVGILDEIFQSSVPGRESSRFDFLADVVGAVCGQVALVMVWGKWKKNERKKESNR